MRTEHDSALLKRYIAKDELTGHIAGLGLEFFIFIYEKGELIVSPARPLEHLLFLERGTVEIYDISEDGGKFPVGVETGSRMLGDMEFCQREYEPFFVEAMTQVTCLALPLGACRSTLEKDPRFLLFLAHSLVSKVEKSGKTTVHSHTVKERVLFYMENVWPDGELVGMDFAAAQLGCSRRQLQRAIKDLCAQGKILKTSRGRYRPNG